MDDSDEGEGGDEGQSGEGDSGEGEGGDEGQSGKGEGEGESEGESDRCCHHKCDDENG